MTNKPNTDKTIEDLKTKLIDEVFEVTKKTGVGWGSDEALGLIIDGAVDAAIQLCEQRDRELVEALELIKKRVDGCAFSNTDRWGDVMELVYRVTTNTLKKHRGENDSKD